MPRYDIRCRQCGCTFEVTRSMTDLDRPAPCPDGHTDTVRLLRAVAVTSSGRTASGGPASASTPAPRPAAGGCCGGGCCG